MMAQLNDEMEQDELTVLVDPDIADLVPGFLENRRRDVDTLRQALRDGNLGAVSFIGHTMKGAGAGYGFPVISNIGSALEQYGKSGNASAAALDVERLSTYLEQVRVIEE
jgi:HPt (histidine-containing phosphotransfer) domain-containing protein